MKPVRMTILGLFILATAAEATNFSKDAKKPVPPDEPAVKAESLKAAEDDAAKREVVETKNEQGPSTVAIDTEQLEAAEPVTNVRTETATTKEEPAPAVMTAPPALSTPPPATPAPASAKKAPPKKKGFWDAKDESPEDPPKKKPAMKEPAKKDQRPDF